MPMKSQDNCLIKTIAGLGLQERYKEGFNQIQQLEKLIDVWGWWGLRVVVARIKDCKDNKLGGEGLNGPYQVKQGFLVTRCLGLIVYLLCFDYKRYRNQDKTNSQM